MQAFFIFYNSSFKRADFIAFPVAGVVLSHGSCFVSQQLLSMCQIPGIGRSLGANVAELKIHLGRFPCAIKTRTQCAIGEPISRKLSKYWLGEFEKSLAWRSTNNNLYLPSHLLIQREKVSLQCLKRVQGSGGKNLTAKLGTPYDV
ncbi:MAG: hypothetical protein WAW10_14600 [Gallionella sp.]